MIVKIFNMTSKVETGNLEKALYIGPWQEYNLGKSAVISQHVQEDLKENLKRALLASLDPIAAAQAIQALDPVLDNRIPQKTQRSKGGNSAILESHRRLNRRYADVSSTATEESKKLALNLKLPPLSDEISTPSSQPKSHANHRTNLESFRTSLSEPINGNKSQNNQTKSKIPYSRQSSARNSDFSSRTNKSSYDVESMMGLLKLERASRQKKPTHDFSQFWEWGGGLNAENNTGTTGPKNTSGIKASTSDNRRKSVDQKLQEKAVAIVQQMGKLYKSSAANEENNSNTNNITHNSYLVQGSSSVEDMKVQNDILLFQPVSTPIIKERDITDTDMKLVEKYFRQLEAPKTYTNHSNKNNVPSYQTKPDHPLQLISPILPSNEIQARNSDWRRAQSPVQTQPSHTIHTDQLQPAPSQIQQETYIGSTAKMSVSPIRQHSVSRALALGLGPGLGSRGALARSGLLPPLASTDRTLKPGSRSGTSSPAVGFRVNSPGGGCLKTQGHPAPSPSQKIDRVESRDDSRSVGTPASRIGDDNGLLRWCLELDVDNIDALY